MEHLRRGSRNGHEQSLGIAPLLADILRGYSRVPMGAGKSEGGRTETERRRMGWSRRDYIDNQKQLDTLERAAAVGSIELVWTAMDRAAVD